MARRPGKFNEAKVREDALMLAQTNPMDLVDVTVEQKRKINAMKNQAAGAMEGLVDVLAQGGSAFAMGVLYGTQEYDKQKIEEEWRAAGNADTTSPFIDGDETDPTLLLGFLPTVLGGTLVLAGITAFLPTNSQFRKIVRSATLGGASLYTGILGMQVGMTMRQNRDDADSAATTAA